MLEHAVIVPSALNNFPRENRKVLLFLPNETRRHTGRHRKMTGSASRAAPSVIS